MEAFLPMSSKKITLEFSLSKYLISLYFFSLSVSDFWQFSSEMFDDRKELRVVHSNYGLFSTISQIITRTERNTNFQHPANSQLTNSPDAPIITLNIFIVWYWNWNNKLSIGRYWANFAHFHGHYINFPSQLCCRNKKKIENTKVIVSLPRTPYSSNKWQFITHRFLSVCVKV